MVETEISGMTQAEDRLTITIFYSWQSDSPSKTNHRFIKESLEEAVKRLVANGHVEEAPRLDHDTKGVHGDPDIFPTILKKIDDCDVFIADVTIVAQTQDGKNIPNPNVLLELGYAYKASGAGRIIKVMNISFGDPNKGLPFDLAHKRWPYTFTMPDNADKATREKEKGKVSKDLADFIRLILEKEGPKNANPPVFSEIELAWKSSSFIEDGILGQYERLNQHIPIQWKNGTQWFLRVIPPKPLQNMTSRKLSDYHLKKPLPPFGRFSGISKMDNNFGIVSFQQTPGEPIEQMTQLFRSGEIWGIEKANETMVEKKLIPLKHIVTVFKDGLSSYLSFCRDVLYISPPVKIIAGISGIAGFAISSSPSEHNPILGRCSQDEVLHETLLLNLDVEAIEVLAPFFQKLWEEFSLPGTWDKAIY